MPKLLLTRPYEDSLSLATKLEALNVKTLISPVLTLQYFQDIVFPHNYFTAIVTSRHAIRALALNTMERSMPIIAVGDATAEMAEKLGFYRVFHGENSAKSLINFILEKVPTSQPLIYAHGKTIKYYLHDILEEEGYSIQNIVVYDAVGRTEMAPDIIEALKTNQLTHVAFFSERSVQIFLQQLQHHKIEGVAQHLETIAFSQDIAQQLFGSRWKGVHVLEYPSLNSFLQFCGSTL